MNGFNLDNINPELDFINYLQCQKGFKTNERIFETPYFLYVHKGKGIYVIGETSYQCKAGDLFFCPGGVSNTIIADDTEPYLLTGVDFSFGKPEDGNPAVRRNGGREDGKQAGGRTDGRKNGNQTDGREDGKVEDQLSGAFKEYINLNNHPQFLWITMELIQRYTVGDVFYNEYVKSLFKTWLLLVYNLSHVTVNSSLAETVAAYLAANSNRNLSLDEISSEFKYHPNYINRIFRNRFGTAIKRYHNDLRIKRAMELLVYSHYSIGEISVLCGFEDFNYFSRLFKQKTSMTATQYRKRMLM